MRVWWLWGEELLDVQLIKQRKKWINFWHLAWIVVFSNLYQSQWLNIYWKTSQTNFFQYIFVFSERKIFPLFYINTLIEINLELYCLDFHCKTFQANIHFRIALPSLFNVKHTFLQSHLAQILFFCELL